MSQGEFVSTDAVVFNSLFVYLAMAIFMALYLKMLIIKITVVKMLIITRTNNHNIIFIHLQSKQ